MITTICGTDGPFPPGPVSLARIFRLDFLIMGFSSSTFDRGYATMRSIDETDIFSVSGSAMGKQQTNSNATLAADAGCSRSGGHCRRAAQNFSPVCGITAKYQGEIDET